MASRHLSRSDISRLLSQQLEHEERSEVGNHLDTCAFCRERVRRLSPEAPVPVAGTASPTAPLDAAGIRTYEEAFRHASRVLSSRAVQAEEDLQAAPARLSALLGLTPAARLDRVRETSDFRSRSLVDLLLQHCKKIWLDDPDEGERLGELAVAIVDRLDTTYFGAAHVADLKARCWATIVNTRRIRADLHSAEVAAQTALAHLERGTGDPLARAEVLSLLASLRRDQRRLEEAASYLNQAIGGYRRHGSRHQVARAMLKRSQIEADMERPAKALVLLDRVARYLDVDLEPRLTFTVLEQRVVFLHQLGRSREAVALLPALRDAAARVGSERDRTYVAWVEGLIAVQDGRDAEAERLLLQARDRFAAAGIGFDAALVSLDLATLYFRQNRMAETRDLAVSMMAIFQAIDIHREAFAALVIFRQTVEAETVTLGMIESIATYLRGLRTSTPKPYEKPS